MPKKRTCARRGCRKTFAPIPMGRKVCSPKCAVAYAREEEERKRAEAKKARKAQTRADLERLKNKPKLTKEAQAAFNRFIRELDQGRMCVSCGRKPSNDGLLTGSRIDCGHFLTVGARPELRFELLNAHLQCSRCNDHGSGRQADQEETLLRWYGGFGRRVVAWLKGPHEIPNWTRDDLREIRDHWREQYRWIRAERRAGRMVNPLYYRLEHSPFARTLDDDDNPQLAIPGVTA